MQHVIYFQKRVSVSVVAALLKKNIEQIFFSLYCPLSYIAVVFRTILKYI